MHDHTRNPAKGVPLPRRVAKKKVYLAHAQVDRLAHAAGPYGPLVLVLAYTGLRWGELAALKVGRVDLARRRLSIVENVVDVSGKLEWGTPKSHETREVPFPAFLSEIFSKTVKGKARDELVFLGPRGGVLRHNTTRFRTFDPAVKIAGTAIAHLQEELAMPKAARTGVFDDATADAVKVWQAAHYLPVTAVVDEATWRSIAAVNGSLASGSREWSSDWATGTLPA